MTTLGAHPTRLDLYVHPGDPIDFEVPVLDTDGAAVDVSTWTATAVATFPDGASAHDFQPITTADGIRVTASGHQTALWTTWESYAARLVVCAVSPTGVARDVLVGWIRTYIL